MEERRQEAKLIEAAPGVYRLKIPMNIQKGSVNSYLLRGAKGDWVIVDPGYFTEACLRGWESAMEELNIRFEDISLILNTHFHGDHAGMAGWFERRCSAPIYLHPDEILSYHAEWDNDLLHVDTMVAYMSPHGLHGWRIDELREQMARIGTASIEVCSRFLELQEGDSFAIEGGRLHTILAPGHSSGHCMFYCPERKLLFSGDMILPITYPPVGLRSYGDTDPIGSAIRSLDKLAEAFQDPGILCLPGHGWAIDEPAERAGAAADHFRETAQWYLERCKREEVNAFQVAEEIASGGTKRKFHLLMSEAMAYFQYLHLQGKITRRRGEDGLVYYGC